PCCDTLPALPLCFSRSEMSRSIFISFQIVDDCLHRIGFRNQTVVVTIQTIGPSHDHQPTAWQIGARVAPLAQMFRRRQCPLCMAVLDGDVLSLYVATLAQPAEL